MWESTGRAIVQGLATDGPPVVSTLRYHQRMERRTSVVDRELFGQSK